MKEIRECCSCGKITDNKNKYGYICRDCNDTRLRVFNKLIKETEDGKRNNK